MTNLLSVTEAAAARGVDVSTVRRWCSTGILKAQRLGARSWMIDAADLDGFEAPKRGAPRRKAHDKETD